MHARLWVVLALALAPLAAQGQTTANQDVLGYFTTSGCPGGASVCWKPYDTTGAGIPTVNSPSTRTIVPLDISSVTTGGTAVNALSAGHATAGGFLVTANAAGMCVNQQGAAGTATSGATVCVAQNQAFTLVPSAAAVSVNSTASSVTIGGEGLN